MRRAGGGAYKAFEAEGAEDVEKVEYSSGLAKVSRTG
jgi:hypothetical protein